MRSIYLISTFFYIKPLSIICARAATQAKNIWRRVHKEAFLGGVITSSDTSKFIGYSFNAADPAPNTRVNYAVYQPKDTPFFDFQYAEVEFLLAEAILRGFITGDANMHYQAGITAHMQSLAMLPTAPSISSAQINAYLAKNPMVDLKVQQPNGR
jgi:hypothetical protein